VIHKRRHKRFRLGSQQLSGQMTFASEVSILDIGMGGVSLRADKRLNIGGKYMLKLEVNKKLVPVTCEVAWARMSGTKRSASGEVVPVYTAGMKFVGLSAENVSDLLRFVEAISDKEAAREDDRREHPRFPARAPGIALLNFPADYKARTISLSGMLIESGEAVESESKVPMVLSLHDGRRIDFLGRIVSCQPKDEDGATRYQIGIEFIELTDAARDALAAFIDWLSAIDGETNPV
jgi:hypothetical protein